MTSLANTLNYIIPVWIVESVAASPKNPDHVSCSTGNLQKRDEYFEAECLTLNSIHNRLNHDEISLLKMDIEGAENAVIGDLVESWELPEILCIEFDEVHTPLDSNFNGKSQLISNCYFGQE
ncbi:MAG: FkbM family methyltransferase [Pseudodesulfovibrio sp.]